VSKQLDIFKKASAVTEQEMLGREIVGPIVVDAKLYHDRAHCLLPVSWIDEYVTAVLESEKDSPDATKITYFVSEFGTGAHLAVSRDWLGERVFIEKIGKRETDQGKKKVRKAIESRRRRRMGDKRE